MAGPSTSSTQGPPIDSARRVVAWIVRRWPTWVALALTVLTFEGGELEPSVVDGYGEALFLLPWPYLVGAQLQRRDAAWPLLAIGITTIVALRILDVVAPSIFFVSAALIALLHSALSGRLRASGTVRIEALGMVGFVLLGLLALAIDPSVGVYLVAAGWLFHGIWDFVHLRLDAVVVRSYAEWCGVLDVLIAVELVLLGI